MPPRPDAAPIERGEIKEEIVRPWEEMEVKDEEETQQKARESLQLSDGNRAFCEKFLQGEADEARRQFAREWFDEHIDELREQGVPVREISEEQKANLAIERGALKDLREDDRYQDQYEQIEDVNSLRVDLQGRGLHLETPLLILNRLEKAAEALKAEIADMQADGKSAEEIAIKQKDLEDNFQARQELSQKVTGHNYREEADDQIEQDIESRARGYLNKETYVTLGLNQVRRQEATEDRLTGVFQAEWGRVAEADKVRLYGNDPRRFADARLHSEHRRLAASGIALNEATLLTLICRGQHPESLKRGGFFITNIEINGQKLSVQDFQRFCFEQNRVFGEEVTEEAQKRLGQQWENWKSGEIHRRADAWAGQLAKSPERAIEGVHGMCEKLRSQLLAEFAEKELRKDPKSKAELDEIKKQFDKEGLNTAQLMGDVLERRGNLNGLTGDLSHDSGPLRNFMEDYGVKMSEAELKKRLGGKYNRAMLKREKGFLDLILDVMFGSNEPEKKKTKRR